MTDLYTLLGLSPDATTAKIRAAYRMLAKTAHPDAGGDEEGFEAIKLAHDVLTDPVRRKRYDETGKVEDMADNADAEAYNAIAGVLHHALTVEQEPNLTKNWAQGIKDVLVQQQGQLNVAISQMERAQHRASTLAARFARRDTDGPNVIASMLSKQGDDARGRAEELRKQVRIFDRAIAIMDGYMFLSDPDPMLAQQDLLRAMMRASAGLGGYSPYSNTNGFNHAGR